MVVVFFDLCSDLLPLFTDRTSQINMSTCRPVEVVGRPFAESVACQVHDQGADAPCQGCCLRSICGIVVSYMQSFTSIVRSFPPQCGKQEKLVLDWILFALNLSFDISLAMHLH